MAEAKSHLARDKYEVKLVVVEAKEYQETRKAMIHSMPSSAFKQHKREGKTNAMGKTKSRDTRWLGMSQRVVKPCTDNVNSKVTTTRIKLHASEAM